MPIDAIFEFEIMSKEQSSISDLDWLDILGFVPLKPEDVPFLMAVQSAAVVDLTDPG